MTINTIPFAFGENLVRVTNRDGAPWFVAADICRALELKGDAGQHVRRLDEDEKGLISIQTPGGTQEVLAVSEAGAFRLVFASRKAEAERFKRWLAHEVLPALRRDGFFDNRGKEPGLDAGRPGDADPLGVLNWRLAAVKEARILFGPARATRLWAEFGLPSVPAAAVDGQNAVSGGLDCLRQLLEADAGSLLGTVERAIDDAVLREDMNAKLFLCQIGVRPEPDDNGFIVANGGQQLAALYAGTPWSRGRWAHALRRLPGTRASAPTRFAGVTMRGTFVPLEVFDKARPPD